MQNGIRLQKTDKEGGEGVKKGGLPSVVANPQVQKRHSQRNSPLQLRCYKRNGGCPVKEETICHKDKKIKWLGFILHFKTFSPVFEQLTADRLVEKSVFKAVILSPQ